jgi:hypothetical protein
MKRILSLATALVLCGALGVAFAADPSAKISETCSKCHPVAKLCGKLGADKAAWTTTITRMQGKGAMVSAEEIPAWSDYLAGLSKDKAPFCK